MKLSGTVNGKAREFVYETYSVDGRELRWELDEDYDGTPEATRTRTYDADGNEMGTITKKWAGIGKELFTSADNYIISLDEDPGPEKAILLR